MAIAKEVELRPGDEVFQTKLVGREIAFVTYIIKKQVALEVDDDRIFVVAGPFGEVEMFASDMFLTKDAAFRAKIRDIMNHAQALQAEARARNSDAAALMEIVRENLLRYDPKCLRLGIRLPNNGEVVRCGETDCTDNLKTICKRAGNAKNRSDGDAEGD